MGQVLQIEIDELFRPGSPWCEPEEEEIAKKSRSHQIKPLPHAFEPYNPATDMEIWKTFQLKSTEWDRIFPRDGFLNDYILYGRGVEVDTRYALWSGIWTINRILGRDAWFGWGDDKLYANFYIAFVSAAGISRKSTMVKKSLPILDKMYEYIPDDKVRYEKEFNQIYSKASEASLYMLASVKSKNFMKIEEVDGETGEDAPRYEERREKEEEKSGEGQEEARGERKIDGVGEMDRDAMEEGDAEEAQGAAVSRETITRNGNISVVVEEMSTFLGKATHQQGLVDKLNHWYDCPDKDNEATRSRGYIAYENIFCTFFSATTPTGFKESLPESVQAEGFGSRLTIVHIPRRDMTRLVAIPTKLPNVPTKDELAERLAWIAMNARGKYYLSAEAMQEHVKIYAKWKEEIVNDEEGIDVDNRYDIQLLKLATIIRAQKYVPGNEISLQDYKTAKKILDATNDTARELFSALYEPEDSQLESRIGNYLKKRGWTRRDTLRKNLKMKVDELYLSLRELHADKKLLIRNNRKFLKHIRRDMPNSTEFNVIGGKIEN